MSALPSWPVLVWGAAYFAQRNDAIKESFTNPPIACALGRLVCSKQAGPFERDDHRPSNSHSHGPPLERAGGSGHSAGMGRQGPLNLPGDTEFQAKCLGKMSDVACIQFAVEEHPGTVKAGES